ncbi:MAG: acyltransferase family protein [Acidimicrobiales bacterium]
MHGLSGFAVLFVVATNLGLPLPGGYLATDMLLVAIGFELARTVRRPETEEHWLKLFWLGRVAQIGAPVLLAVGLAALYWNWQEQLDEAKLRAVLGAVTMTLNYFVIYGQADFMAIEHLWVVGLIVQFAVVVPLLVNGGRRYLGPEQRSSAMLGLAAGVALCRLGFLATDAAAHQSIAMHGLTRLDGLLIGLAVGIAPPDLLRRVAPARSAAPAFAGLLLLLLLGPDPVGHSTIALGLALPAVVALTGVVLASLSQSPSAATPAEATAGPARAADRGALSMTVDNHLMRWLGARAMSVFIWHHVFGLALETEVLGPEARLEEWPGFAVFIVRAIFSLAAAATSYRYLELPAMAAAEQIANRPGEDDLEAIELQRQSATESVGGLGRVGGVGG